MVLNLKYALIKVQTQPPTPPLFLLGVFLGEKVSLGETRPPKKEL
jgi:xanthosine utilization system XapX-like protein